MPAPTWKSVAEMLRTLAQILNAEWKCGFPPRGMIPDDQLEAECDVWARKLADNLAAEDFQPPEYVRSWLLARLAVAVYAAQCEHENGTPFPFPTLSPEFFARILVDEWHAELRDDWIAFGDQFGQAFSE